MIRQFFKNSLLYTLGTVITRGISIFLVPIYTRYLSPTEYGIIDLFVIIASIINLTIALEISQAIARYYQDAKNDYLKAIYTSTAFWFTMTVYSIYFIISIIFSDTFTVWLLNSIDYKTIFILASLSIATNGIFYFVQNQLKWQIQPKDSVIVSVFNGLLIMSIAIFLLVYFELKVESIFIAQIIANVLASLLAIYYAKKSYKFLFNYKKFKEMISFSAPLVFSGIAVFLAMYIDRIAIKDLLGLSELGIYGVAYRFASITGLVMIGFQSSLAPLIYKYYKEENTPKQISDIFNIFVLFALFTIGGSVVFSKEILVLFTTPDYYDANTLIALLVMVGFFSNMYIFAPGIGIAKKTKYIIFITIIIAIANTLLNYIFIPIWGINGAAYATLISSIVGFLMYILISYRFYPIPYEVKKLLISFFITLISAYFIKIILNELNMIFIIIKILYLISFFFIISIILLNQDQLKYLKEKIMKP